MYFCENYLKVFVFDPTLGKRNILYKGVEASPYQTRFKNFEGKLEMENLKRTIFAIGRLGLLHFVTIFGTR